MSHYITKALAWYWNLTIVFSSHSTYKPLNGFVVYIRFLRIGLYKLLEIPLLGIGYGIPENVFNNFMEGTLIIHISDFIIRSPIILKSWDLPCFTVSIP